MEKEQLESPSIHFRLNDPAFIAESANIMGNVTIEKDSSVWFNSVIRGDVNSILIKEKTNIQDFSVLHACTVGNYALIGMGAIVLDGATIGNFSLIAAGALILQNAKIPDGVLVAGIPEKIIRELKKDEKKQIELSAINYINFAKSYK